MLAGTFDVAGPHHKKKKVQAGSVWDSPRFPLPCLNSPCFLLTLSMEFRGVSDGCRGNHKIVFSGINPLQAMLYVAANHAKTFNFGVGCCHTQATPRLRNAFLKVHKYFCCSLACQIRTVISYFSP